MMGALYFAVSFCVFFFLVYFEELLKVVDTIFELVLFVPALYVWISEWKICLGPAY